MQHRSAATPTYTVAPLPQRQGTHAAETREDALDGDYFSTVWPEAIETAQRAGAAPGPVPVLSTQPTVRAATHSSAQRRRQPLRPIPLQFAQPRFADLAPTEHWFARVLGGIFAATILLSGLLISAQVTAGSIPQPTFASPTINTVAARIARESAIQLPTVQLPFRLSISPASLPYLASLMVIGLVIYSLGRRTSGVFGGLLAMLLLVSCGMQHGEMQIAQAIALLGVLLITIGWRDEAAVRSIAGSVLLGMAASMSHAEALLLPIILLVTWDLPWKWSWLLPLGWLAAAGAIAASDWRYFNWRPVADWTHAFATLDVHQSAAAALRLIDSRGESLIYLLPLGVVGVGSLMKIDRRWGVTIVAMTLPAAIVFLLHSQMQSTAVTLVLPPLILAAVWLMSRSALAAGLITAFVCQMALRLALAI